jgi:hypothetical protein
VDIVTTVTLQVRKLGVWAVSSVCALTALSSKTDGIDTDFSYTALGELANYQDSKDKSQEDNS